jgi:hypothetical protein
MNRRYEDRTPVNPRRAVRAFCVKGGCPSRRVVELLQRFPTVSLHEELTEAYCQYATETTYITDAEGIGTEVDVLALTEQTLLLPATACVPTMGNVSVTRPGEQFGVYFGNAHDVKSCPNDERDDESVSEASSDDDQGRDKGPTKRLRDDDDAAEGDPASTRSIALEDVCTSIPRSRNQHEPIDCVSLCIPVRSQSNFADVASTAGHGETFVVTLREILDPDFLRGVQGGSIGTDQFLREESMRQARLETFRAITKLRRGTRASDVIDLVGQHVLPGRCLSREEADGLRSNDPDIARAAMNEIVEDVLWSLFEDLEFSKSNLSAATTPFVRFSYCRSNPSDPKQVRLYTTHVLMFNGALVLPRGLPTHVLLADNNNNNKGKTQRAFTVELTPISEKVKHLRVAGYYLCPRPQFEAALAVEFLREVYRQALVRLLLNTGRYGVMMMRLKKQHDELVMEQRRACDAECRLLDRLADRLRIKQEHISFVSEITSALCYKPLFPTEEATARKMEATEFEHLLAPALSRDSASLRIPTTDGGDEIDVLKEVENCVTALRKHYGFRKFPIPLPLLEDLICALGTSICRAREVVNLVLEFVDQSLVGLE